MTRAKNNDKQKTGLTVCMKARQPKYSEPKGSARYYWLLW